MLNYYSWWVGGGWVGQKKTKLMIYSMSASDRPAPSMLTFIRSLISIFWFLVHSLISDSGTLETLDFLVE